MEMRVSSNGEVVLPASLRYRLGIRPGDVLDVTVDETVEPGQPMRIFLTPQRKAQFVGKIVDDPITGLPVIDFGPDAPILTSEMVAEMLADFP